MRRAVTLDPLDVGIIRSLQADGRVAYSEMAKQFHVAEGTVRKRVTRLLGVANPFRVGMDVVAIIGLNVARQKMAQARAHLQRLEPVRYIAITTGTFDYIVEVVLPSNQDLLRFLVSDLARVPGLDRTETSLVLEIPKQSYDWLPPRTHADRRRPAPDGAGRPAPSGAERRRKGAAT
jgi:Lrp/AsnC family transcriptional regulator for asnA, asnC and gidA